MEILSWVIFCVGLPVIGAAIYRLVPLIKRDQAAPIYVINLLMSDVLQISASATLKSLPSNMWRQVMQGVNNLGLIGSVCFMVCIAGERYFKIAHPVWYRLHRTVKKSLIVCVAIWVSSISAVITIATLIVTKYLTYETYSLCGAVFFLLPYPLVLFFFARTWVALLKSRSVRQQERRKILGTLALVLCIYTVFFLPHIVTFITVAIEPQIRLQHGFSYLLTSARILLYLNPLFDPILYVFMRTDVKGIKGQCLHCSRERNYSDQADTPVSK